jgi:FAD/FMN-containing dehydrogenase
MQFLTTTIATGILAASLVSADSEIANCLSTKGVPVVWPNNTDYANLSKPFNLRLEYKPYAVVLPTTNQHVQDAVVCAAKCGIKVQAKSGGHSYASFSSGGKDGSMSECQRRGSLTGD